MRLVAKENWTDSVGKILGFTKKRFTWTLEEGGSPVDVQLFVSRLSGKHRLFVNSEMVAEQGSGLCGQEILSGKFKGAEFAVRPVDSQGGYELEVNGVPFSQLNRSGPSLRKKQTFTQSETPLFDFSGPKKKVPFFESGATDRNGISFDSGVPRPHPVDSLVVSRYHPASQRGSMGQTLPGSFYFPTGPTAEAPVLESVYLR